MESITRILILFEEILLSVSLPLLAVLDSDKAFVNSKSLSSSHFLRWVQFSLGVGGSASSGKQNVDNCRGSSGVGGRKEIHFYPVLVGCCRYRHPLFSFSPLYSLLPFPSFHLSFHLSSNIWFLASLF